MARAVEGPAMPLPPLPDPWPLSSAEEWQNFRQALEGVPGSLGEHLRIECARELDRIARCASSRAEPPRHDIVPGPVERASSATRVVSSTAKAAALRRQRARHPSIGC